jgi:hypothetical protein
MTSTGPIGNYSPGRESRLLDELWATLTSHSPTADRSYTSVVMTTVLETVKDAELAGYLDTLRAFVILHHDDLAMLLHDFGPGSSFTDDCAYEIVQSPAVIAVCERLVSKPMWLRSVWREQWESETPLESLSTAWPHSRLYWT